MAELRLYQHSGYDGVLREYVVIVTDLKQCDADFKDYELIATVELTGDMNEWPTDRTLREA